MTTENKKHSFFLPKYVFIGMMCKLSRLNQRRLCYVYDCRAVSWIDCAQLVFSTLVHFSDHAWWHVFRFCESEVFRCINRLLLKVCLLLGLKKVFAFCDLKPQNFLRGFRQDFLLVLLTDNVKNLYFEHYYLNYLRIFYFAVNFCNSSVPILW